MVDGPARATIIVLLAFGSVLAGGCNSSLPRHEKQVAALPSVFAAAESEGLALLTAVLPGNDGVLLRLANTGQTPLTVRRADGSVWAHRTFGKGLATVSKEIDLIDGEMVMEPAESRSFLIPIGLIEKKGDDPEGANPEEARVYVDLRVRSLRLGESRFCECAWPIVYLRTEMAINGPAAIRPPRVTTRPASQ